MLLQINTMVCGELASPGVRHSRVQHIRPPECIPFVTNLCTRETLEKYFGLDDCL